MLGNVGTLRESTMAITRLQCLSTRGGDATRRDVACTTSSGSPLSSCVEERYQRTPISRSSSSGSARSVGQRAQVATAGTRNRLLWSFVDAALVRLGRAESIAWSGILRAGHAPFREGRAKRIRQELASSLGASLDGADSQPLAVVCHGWKRASVPVADVQRSERIQRQLVWPRSGMTLPCGST
jgi:hypothetical protein